jgi:hypothetical protein
LVVGAGALGDLEPLGGGVGDVHQHVEPLTGLFLAWRDRILQQVCRVSEYVSLHTLKIPWHTLDSLWIRSRFQIPPIFLFWN